MKTREGDGGPAFPGGTEGKGCWETIAKGMSLRDYAAIHADITKADFPDVAAVAEYVGEPSPGDYFGMLRLGIKAQAKLRYEMADAMLAAREVRS